MKDGNGKIVNERKVDWGQVVIFGVSVLFLTGVLYGSLINNGRRLCKVEEKISKIDVLITEVNWIKETMQEVYQIK